MPTTPYPMSASRLSLLRAQLAEAFIQKDPDRIDQLSRAMDAIQLQHWAEALPAGA